MLPKRSSFILNAIIISFLASSSYVAMAHEATTTPTPPEVAATEPAKAPEPANAPAAVAPKKSLEAAAPKYRLRDSWIKVPQEKTESQKAAETAKEARRKEMEAMIATRNAKEATPEAAKVSPEPTKKPVAEPKKETSTAAQMRSVPPKALAPEKKRLTLREQIALNKKKRADELLKKQEMEKEKATAATKHVAKPEVKHEVKHEAKPIAMSPSEKKMIEEQEAAEKKGKEVHAPAPAIAAPIETHPTIQLKEASAPKVAMNPVEEHETTTLTLNKENAEKAKAAKEAKKPMASLTMTEEEHETTTLTLNKKNAEKARAAEEAKAKTEPAAASSAPPPPPPQFVSKLPVKRLPTSADTNPKTEGAKASSQVGAQNTGPQMPVPLDVINAQRAKLKAP